MTPRQREICDKLREAVRADAEAIKAGKPLPRIKPIPQPYQQYPRHAGWTWEQIREKTQADCREALAMRAEGVPWKIIARKLGRAPKSVRQSVWVFKSNAGAQGNAAQ